MLSFLTCAAGRPKSSSGLRLAMRVFLGDVAAIARAVMQLVPSEHELRFPLKRLALPPLSSGFALKQQQMFDARSGQAGFVTDTLFREDNELPRRRASHAYLRIFDVHRRVINGKDPFEAAVTVAVASLEGSFEPIAQAAAPAHRYAVSPNLE